MKPNNNNNNNNNHSKKKNAKNKNFISPYQQAGSILNQVWAEAPANSHNSNKNSSSRLKSVVYDASSGNLKCSASTYAISAKVLAHESLLQSILERSAETLGNNTVDIQNEGLYHVLLYELLLGPNKSIRGGGALKRQILQHETVLRKTLTDIQKEQQTQHASFMRKSSDKEDEQQPNYPLFPRYVRVNTLRTTMSRVVTTWQQEQHQQQQKVDSKKKKKDDNDNTTTTNLVFYQDVHVPNLLVFPHYATKALLSSSLARNHEVILQDKSSCFPALCLVHGFDEYYYANDDDDDDTSTSRHHRRVYLDACAAPGNKTSHLAALLALETANNAATRNSTKQYHDDDHDDNDDDDDDATTFPIQVYALDRSKERCESLKRRMKQLLPDNDDDDKKVQIHAQCRDFLSLGRPQQEPDNNNNNTKKKKKSKNQPHKNDSNISDDADHAIVQQVTDILLDPSCSGSGIFHRSNENEDYHHNHQDDEESSLQHRLQSLSNFQTTALRHALTNFVNVQRVVYSTCSIQEQENEGVVAEVLNDLNIQSKWQLVAPKCLRDWKRRGQQQEQQMVGQDDDKKSTGIPCLTKEQLATLIRVDGDDETNGFFVACFARKRKQTMPSAHTKIEKKKSKTTSASNTTSAASKHVMVKPIPNVPFYNGQFKITAASPKNSDKPESSIEKRDQSPTKKTDANKACISKSSSSASGKKRRSASSTSEESNNKKSADNQIQEHQGGKSNNKKQKLKTDIAKTLPPQQQQSDPSTKDKTTKQKDHADDESEKPLPKKVAKKLEWKRRQHLSKVQRLHSKQQPQKNPKK